MSDFGELYGTEGTPCLDNGDGRAPLCFVRGPRGAQERHRGWMFPGTLVHPGHASPAAFIGGQAPPLGGVRQAGGCGKRCQPLVGSSASCPGHAHVGEPVHLLDCPLPNPRADLWSPLVAGDERTGLRVGKEGGTRHPGAILGRRCRGWARVGWEAVTELHVVVPDDIAERLQAAAASRGSTAEEVAAELISSHVPPVSGRPLSFLGMFEAPEGFDVASAEERYEAEGFIRSS